MVSSGHWTDGSGFSVSVSSRKKCVCLGMMETFGVRVFRRSDEGKYVRTYVYNIMRPKSRSSSGPKPDLGRRSVICFFSFLSITGRPRNAWIGSLFVAVAVAVVMFTLCLLFAFNPMMDHQSRRGKLGHHPAEIKSESTTNCLSVNVSNVSCDDVSYPLLFMCASNKYLPPITPAGGTTMRYYLSCLKSLS